MTLSDTEVRLLGLSAPQLVKLLQAREARLLNKLYGELKSGKHDQLTSLIEFAVIRDIQNDIQTALRRFEAAQEVTHAEHTTDDQSGPSTR